MGGQRSYQKFIVGWENGTRVAAIIVQIELEMCINFAQLFSVADKVKINEQNTSIATGPLYTPKLMRFERLIPT